MIIYPEPVLVSDTHFKMLTRSDEKYFTYPPGLVFNKTFRFNDGSTNELFTGNSAFDSAWNGALTGANKQFTIYFILRKEGALATTNFIMGRDSGSPNRQFVIQKLTTNKIQITIYTNATNFIQYVSGFNSGDSTQEIHYALVYDGTLSATSRISLYRNGILDIGFTCNQTGTFTTINNITTPGIEIGGRTTTSQVFVGDISVAALFDTNLSGAVISSELYDAGTKFNFINSSAGANLKSYLVAGNETVYAAGNWTWKDLIDTSRIMTSANMELGDLVTL
jgi:hypothetical protein